MIFMMSSINLILCITFFSSFHFFTLVYSNFEKKTDGKTDAYHLIMQSFGSFENVYAIFEDLDAFFEALDAFFGIFKCLLDVNHANKQVTC